MQHDTLQTAMAHCGLIAILRGITPADAAETAAAAKSAVERGFTAVKMNGTEELQYIDSHDKVEKCLDFAEW